jgi:hypothetical protein
MPTYMIEVKRIPQNVNKKNNGSWRKKDEIPRSRNAAKNILPPTKKDF